MHGKNMVFKLPPKMLLANQTLIFVNCQYRVNGYRSDPNFLYEDR